MILRLILGRKCRVKWDVGDSLTVFAIILSVARIALTHVTILWKTNRFSEEYRKTHHFSDLEIYQREIGSKFTLAARLIYIFMYVSPEGGVGRAHPRTLSDNCKLVDPKMGIVGILSQDCEEYVLGQTGIVDIYGNICAHPLSEHCYHFRGMQTDQQILEALPRSRQVL
jgi:hypothetical protein